MTALEGEPATLDPARTALVLVDLMDRITALPLAPRSGEQVVAVARELAESSALRARPSYSYGSNAPGAAAQPPGSELVAGLAAEDDLIVVKRTIGGFHRTGLHELLAERGSAPSCSAASPPISASSRRPAPPPTSAMSCCSSEDAMAALTEDEHRAAVALELPPPRNGRHRLRLGFG